MRTLSIFVAVVLLCAGCERAIDLTLTPRSPELAVTAYAEEGGVWCAVVQRTVGLGETTSDFPVYIEDADVVIVGNDGTCVELIHLGGGFYHASSPGPRAGVTYQLRVEAPGFPPLTAVETIPVRPVIHSIRTSPITGWGFLAEIDLEGRPDEANYYDIHLSPMGAVVLNPELEAQIRALTPFDPFDPPSGRPFIDRAVIDAGAFDDHRFTLRVETGGGGIAIRRVSESYYHHERTRILQANARHDPFTEPVGVRTNVEGGYGIFAGFGSVTALSGHGESLAGAYRLAGYGGYRDGRQFDLMVQGASGRLILRSDYTAIGALTLPGDGGPREIVLDGGYSTLPDGRVRLHHSTPSVLRDITFSHDAFSGSLSGSAGDSRRDVVSISFVKD